MRYRGMVIATNDHRTTNAATAAMRFQRLSLAMLPSFELRLYSEDSIYISKRRCHWPIVFTMGSSRRQCQRRCICVTVTCPRFPIRLGFHSSCVWKSSLYPAVCEPSSHQEGSGGWLVHQRRGVTQVYYQSPNSSFKTNSGHGT